MTTRATALKEKLHAVNVEPLTEDEPAHEQPQQIAMTPERQLVTRMWLLEDEVQRLRGENAALQEALAKATAGN